MKKNELTQIYNTLIKDASRLPSPYRRAISQEGSMDTKGEASSQPSREDIARVIQSNVYYHRSLPIFEDEASKASGFMVNFPEVGPVNACEFLITENSDVFLVLALLRMEGILEFGKTPSCGSEDPIEFLLNLIEDSGIAYGDTLSELLSLVESQKAFKLEDGAIPGEKLDMAVMLLSLLTPEEISDYIEPPMDQYGDFAMAFMESVGTNSVVMPFIYLDAPQAREIFAGQKFKKDNELGGAASLFSTHFNRLFKKDQERHIAVSPSLAVSLIHTCAKCGAPIGSWLKISDDEMKEQGTDIEQWEFESFNKEVEDFIVTNDGHFLLVLSGKELNDFLDGEGSRPFRKYIVDNGYLKDVLRNYVDFGYTSIQTYIFDIVKDGVQRNVRFYDQDKTFLNKEFGRLKYRLFGFEGSEYANENPVFLFCNRAQIENEDYRLNISLYNGHRSAKNPVRLNELLKPIAIEPSKKDRSLMVEAFSVYDRPHNCLDNYGGYESVGVDEFASLTRWIDSDSAMLINMNWPVHSTFHQRLRDKTLTTVVTSIDFDSNETHDESFTRNIADGLFLSSKICSDDLMAFDVDQSRVNPWYLAYALDNVLSSQIKLRSRSGMISEEDLMKVFIDLPSLQEQKNFVEDIINSEIEKKKIQLGTSEALFNLNHSIGSPANRIQNLLGNLRDEYEGSPETYTQLKKIEDNFGYILRLIKAASMDFEQLKSATKDTAIVPLLRKYISSSSSLPFGLDPVLDCSGIKNDTILNINEDLFSIMMDNIIRNAHRHGFDKKVSSDNKLLIKLDEVGIEDRNWLQMSICNNGKKLEDGYTVLDYITKGNKGCSTGNTGQGGFDIHQIVKKFGGKLCLRSSDEWNFIIDILIPIVDTTIHCNNSYNYGPLV